MSSKKSKKINKTIKSSIASFATNIIGKFVEEDGLKIVDKVIDSHEKNWPEKAKAKKELKELKYKHEIEMLEKKPKKKSKYEMKLEEKKRKEEIERQDRIKQEEKKERSKTKFLGVLLFLIYGVFCIEGFQIGRIFSALTCIIQCILVLISILITENLIKSDKKELNKQLITISILLIIPWIAFTLI